MADKPVGLYWKDLDEAIERLKVQTLAPVARGFSIKVWHELLRRTPQYEGRMVVSWTYTRNRPVAVDRSHLAPARDETVDEPFQAGDRPAIEIANRVNRGREIGFKLGDMVYMVNGANHGEGPYAAKIEAGDVRLRFVNRWGAPMVAKTLAMVRAQYAAGINVHSARQLRRLKIE